MTHHTELGKEGERFAAAYFQKQGYRILARNYRFQKAEVDLVCFQPAESYEDGGVLVFVEVKTRSGSAYGHPEDAVDLKKQQNLKRAARSYLYEHKLEGALCRFDVLAINASERPPECVHFEDAFHF